MAWCIRNPFFVMIALLGSLGLAWPQSAGQNPSISDLKRNAEQYVDQKVTVTGTLQLAGRNYFRDRRFMLVDDQGNQIPVSPWVPLEVPPPMPGRDQGAAAITMRDFLGRSVSVTGVLRVNADGLPTVQVTSARVIADNQPGGKRPLVPQGAPLATNPPRPIPAGSVPDGGTSGVAMSGSTAAPKRATPASQVSRAHEAPMPASGVEAVTTTPVPPPKAVAAEPAPQMPTIRAGRISATAGAAAPKQVQSAPAGPMPTSPPRPISPKKK